jgi:ATP/maltotriose-dependent transcriptional regulator MalT
MCKLELRQFQKSQNELKYQPQFSLDYLNKVLDEFILGNRPKGLVSVTPGYNQIEIELLSQREIEVLHYLAAGLSSQAIAQQLMVAPSTIKSHLKNIYRKLNVENRLGAVAQARSLNLLNS